VKKVVFDCEANGLLDTCTRMWVLVARDVVTNESKQWLPDENGWQEYLESADVLIGHNIIGYDLPMLRKLKGWVPSANTVLHDTMIMSQVLDYRRFGNGGHSLQIWGEYFGYPKIDMEDWSAFTPQMLERCVRDVEINVRLYKMLLAEAHKLIGKSPQFRDYLRAEHIVLKWNTDANIEGWPFDVAAGNVLLARLEAEMAEAHTKLSHKLGTITYPVDRKCGEVEYKFPRWTKDGFYHKSTAAWFGVDICSGFEGEERLIEGPYSRVATRPLELDSIDDMKVFLFRNGWIPTEWNYRKSESGRKTKERTSPKITEDSLEFLGGDGKLYVDFLTTKSRHGILKSWLGAVDDVGLLHGDAVTVGTPSMRSRHITIVNVPTPDSPYGKEMRSLFKCEPSWRLIGVDSKGNQARALAHYLDDQEYADILMAGSIHEYNAGKLTEILKKLGVSKTVEKHRAKRVYYAFLFGAAGSKLWNYIFDETRETEGNRLKKEFTKAVPGLEELMDKLAKVYGSTRGYSEGYIYGIAGNKIYVDSFHKLLVYLLQAAEKATCACSIMLMVERLEEEGIPYKPCIFMHDETQFRVPEAFAAKAAEIGEWAFSEGPKLMGVQIMDGEAKVGNNWFETH
jgi:hypothetical protein